MTNEKIQEEPSNNDESEIEELLEEWKKAEEEGRVQDASAFSMAVLAYAAQHADDHPDEDSLLREQAREHLEQCEWRQAEQSYKSLLKRFEDDKDLEKGAANAWHTWQHLMFLDLVNGRDEQIGESARQATECAQRSGFLVLHLQSFAQQAQIELRFGHIAQAQSAILAAESLLETLEESERAAYHLQIARIAIEKAACLLTLEKMSEAEHELQKAWEILQPKFGNFSAGGVHAALVHWWATTAQMRTARGDLKGAASAWHESVDRRRHLATLPHIQGVQMQFYLADTLKHYAQAARTADEFENAQTAEQEASAILDELKLT